MVNIVFSDVFCPSSKRGPGKKSAVTRQVHPVRRLCIPGVDNEVVNKATCGIWNVCGGDGPFFVF